jgi:hypothetical protein
VKLFVLVPWWALILVIPLVICWYAVKWTVIGSYFVIAAAYHFGKGFHEARTARIHNT